MLKGNSMRKIVISSAVAALMVGVLSLLLFRESGGRGERLEDAGALSPSKGAAKAVRNAHLAGAAAGAASGKQAGGGAAAVPSPDAPVLLSGKVLDPDGKGVPGARIAVHRSEEEIGGFESFIRARALGRSPPTEILGRAVSAADGRYAVAFASPPPAGEYRVEARAAGFIPGEEAWLFEGTPGVVDLHLDDGGETIEGIVIDLAGAPIEGAEVDARADGDDRFARFQGRGGSSLDQMTTDATGSFRLVVAPGRYRVGARAQGFAVAAASEVESGTEGLRIELGPSRNLSGRVVDDMGNPVEAALLAAYPGGGDDRGFPGGGPGGGPGGFRGGDRIRRFMDPAGRAETGADGQFTIYDLSLRGYQVEARKGGFEVAVERGTLPAEGESTPVEIHLKPGGILTGTVSDPDGAPVKGAMVLLRDEASSDRDRRAGGRFGGRDLSGRFPGGGPGGSGGFAGRGGNPGGAAGESGAGEAGVTGSDAGPGGRTGGFGGRRGGPGGFGGRGGGTGGPESSRASETVSLFGADHVAETDESGRFSFDTIARSTYTLGVRSERHAAFIKNAVAVEEKTELPITLDRGAALIGRVLESGGSTPVAKAIVRARIGNDDRRSARTDDEGKFRLEGLVSGRLDEVQVRAKGYTTLYVEGLEIKAATGEETHDLVLDRAASLSGQVVNARGEPVANARVRMASTEGETPADFGDQGQGGAAEADAADLIRRLSRRRTENQRIMTTKADGTFHIENLGAGTSYRAIITHPDYQELRSDPVAVQPGAQIEGLVFKLKAGGRLNVLVLRPDRTPGPGLAVVVSRQRQEDSGAERRFNPANRNDRQSRNTSPEGKAVFAGLAGGLYSIQVSANGYQPFRQRDVPVVDDQSSDFVVSLLPENTIVGVVADSSGAPLAGVSVRAFASAESRQGDIQAAAFGGRGGGFFGGGGERGSATSQADGTFKIGSLGLGPYQVVLSARGYADQRLEAVEVNGRPLEIQLQKKGAIEGVVTVGETGEAVTRFRVALQRESQGGQGSETDAAGQAGEQGRDFRRRGGRPMDFDDAGGAFAIPDVDPGAYALRVSAEGLTPREVTVRVVEGMTAAARVQLFAGIVVSGLVVVEGTSDPVEATEITVIAAPEEGSSSPADEKRRTGIQRVSESAATVAGRQPRGGGEGPGTERGGGRRIGRSVVPPAKTDAAGVFALQGINPGKYVLIANHPDFVIAQQSFEIREEGTTRDLRINLHAGESLSGTIAEADGSASAGVSISVRDANGLSKRVTTDTYGRYEVHGLVPGTQTVSVFSQGSPPAREQVEVKQGARNTLDIKRPAPRQ